MRALFLVAAAAAFAQDAGLPPEVLALARIRTRALEHLASLPNYVCLQTIDRYARGRRQSTFRRRDRIALEVAHVEGKELFALPGAGSFVDKLPSDLVGNTGLTSTGDFALGIRAIFHDQATIIRYAGQEKIDSRPALRYEWRAPLFASRLVLTVGRTTAEAGSRGSFWADPKTHDLLRVYSEAYEIPPGIDVQSSTMTVDYRRVRIGGHEVLLPRRSEVTMTSLRGAQSRNVVEFSECRHYVGESKISFAEPAAPELPPGLLLKLELETRIDSDRAAVGMPVRARLREAVGDLRKGARAAGSVRFIVRLPELTQVAVEIADIEYLGRRVPFTAVLEAAEPGAGAAQGPGVVIFQECGLRVVVPAGVKMLWRTAAE